MKDTAKGFVYGFLIASFLTLPLPALAKQIKAIQNIVTIKADKVERKSQKIYLIDKQVYLPLKTVGEVFHAKTKYDAKKKIVTLTSDKKKHFSLFSHD